MRMDNSILSDMYQAGSRVYESVNSWVEEGTDFNYYIFVSENPSESSLNSMWEQLNNDIALHFQSNLKKSIEIWNIYTFYFVRDKISKETKYRIEQDKYCSRKIVFDGLGDIASDKKMIKKKINETLFVIDLKGGLGSTGVSAESLKEIIQRTNKPINNVLTLYFQSDKRATKKTFLEKYLNKGC